MSFNKTIVYAGQSLSVLLVVLVRYAKGLLYHPLTTYLPTTPTLTLSRALAILEFVAEGVSTWNSPRYLMLPLLLYYTVCRQM